MELSVELVVDGVDLDNPTTARIVRRHLGDVGWASVDGLLTVGIVSDATDAVALAHAIADRIRAHLPDAGALRFHDDFVSIPEIALRAGVSREAVRLWACGQRGPQDFPTPYAFVGVAERRSPIWRWARVSEWLDAHGQRGDGLAFPTDRQIADVNAHLARPRRRTLQPA